MNQEVIFAQTLEKVKRLAGDQGNCISEEQVREAFSDQGLDEGQLQLVLDYLVKNRIGINEPVNQDDYLSDEEKNYLQDYLEEIRAHEEASQGEKEAVTIQAMAGETAAQGRLVELYLAEVVEIAKLYTGQGVLLEDLIGEGNVALAVGSSMLGCLEHVSEADGMLARMVMDACEECIAENAASEKADQAVADRVNEILEKAKEMAEDLSRKVSPGELAEETGMTVEEILEAVRMSGFQMEYIDVSEA